MFKFRVTYDDETHVFLNNKNTYKKHWVKQRMAIADAKHCIYTHMQNQN